MWSTGENPRDIHAVELLSNIHDVSLDRLIAIGYDSRLTAFDSLLPRLFAAYDRLPLDDPRRGGLALPVDTLRQGFRDVLFYPEDVSAHAERRYHPGD